MGFHSVLAGHHQERSADHAVESKRVDVASLGCGVVFLVFWCSTPTLSFTAAEEVRACWGRGGGLTGAAPFGARVSHEATVFSTPRLAEHETKKECPQGPSGRHLLARLRSVHLGVLKVRFSGGETVLEWYFGKSNGVALLRGNQPCRILQWDWRSPRSGLPGLPGFCPWTLTVWYIDGKHCGVFYERVANCHRVSRESHRRRKQVKSLQAWAVALADAPPNLLAFVAPSMAPFFLYR